MNTATDTTAILEPTTFGHRSEGTIGGGAYSYDSKIEFTTVLSEENEEIFAKAYRDATAKLSSPLIKALYLRLYDMDRTPSSDNPYTYTALFSSASSAKFEWSCSASFEVKAELREQDQEVVQTAWKLAVQQFEEALASMDEEVASNV